jgi:C1A family cysteine protease
MLGIAVYDSFETPQVDQYGVVPIPNPKKERLLGGHAIALVGFDVPRRYFKFQNSWGTAWGDKGYGYIPFDYILNKNISFDLVSVSFSV